MTWDGLAEAILGVNWPIIRVCCSHDAARDLFQITSKSSRAVFGGDFTLIPTGRSSHSRERR